MLTNFNNIFTVGGIIMQHQRQMNNVTKDVQLGYQRFTLKLTARNKREMLPFPENFVLIQKQAN